MLFVVVDGNPYNEPQLLCYYESREEAERACKHFAGDTFVVEVPRGENYVEASALLDTNRIRCEVRKQKLISEARCKMVDVLRLWTRGEITKEERAARAKTLRDYYASSVLAEYSGDTDVVEFFRNHLANL